jgi:hypothetical protein
VNLLQCVAEDAPAHVRSSFRSLFQYAIALPSLRISLAPQKTPFFLSRRMA